MFEGKPVNLCITTYNRYDLLPRLLASVRTSQVQPDAMYLIDNGRNPEALAPAIQGFNVTVVPIEAMMVERHARGLDLGYDSLSLAASHNWFLTHVPEERVALHDDVELAPDSLAKFLSTPGAFILDANRGCLIIRDACVQAVGLHDETISPGYYMFEDCDYGHRLALAGIFATMVDIGAAHTPSRTFARTAEDGVALARHHQRFALAHDNYVKKWGGEPQLDPQGISWA